MERYEILKNGGKTKEELWVHVTPVFAGVRYIILADDEGWEYCIRNTAKGLARLRPMPEKIYTVKIKHSDSKVIEKGFIGARYEDAKELALEYCKENNSLMTDDLVFVY